MGLDFTKTFVTDARLELEGVDVPLAAGASVRIARFNNPRMEAHLQKIGKPFARSIKSGSFPPGEMRTLMADAMAHHVLLGWKGIEENGQPLTYSVETAKRLLLQSRDFFDLIFESANEQQHFRDAGVEDASGN